MYSINSIKSKEMCCDLIYIIVYFFFKKWVFFKSRSWFFFLIKLCIRLVKANRCGIALFLSFSCLACRFIVFFGLIFSPNGFSKKNKELTKLMPSGSDTHDSHHSWNISHGIYVKFSKHILINKIGTPQIITTPSCHTD